MKKVYLGVGHGGKDSGAVGYLVEKDVNLVEALACRDFLVQSNIEVKISRTTDVDGGLDEKIKEINEWSPDLAIDVHNNAGQGDGFEVYYYSKGGTGKILAENIETEVKAIGQNSRGCKTRLNSSGTDYFGFIRETNCPAVIAEGVFVDNKNDVQIADTTEKQKAFGVAYARGILKTLGITPTENAAQDNSNQEIKYYVQVGAYAVKENAEKQLQKAKDAGFTDSFIKQF